MCDYCAGGVRPFHAPFNHSVPSPLEQLASALRLLVLTEDTSSTGSRCDTPEASLSTVVVLHCTRKLLTRLPRALAASEVSSPAAAGPTLRSTTRLGDWYANLMVVARRPLVLCAAERSLFAVVVPLAEARTLVPRWRQAVERRLLAIGIAPAQVADELAAMAEVRVVPTSYGAGGGAPGEPAQRARTPSPSVGRRMVGMLTDMAWQCEGRTLRVGGVEQPDLAAMEAALDDLLCTPLAYRRPADVTRELFAEGRSPDPGAALRLVR